MARRSPRFYLKLILAAVVVVGLGFYVLFQSHDLLNGPELSVSSPVNGANFSESAISVTGLARNISFLTLNGLQIFTDESGRFSRDIVLLPGYNVVKIEARDKFGRSVEKTLQLTLGSATTTRN